METEGICLCKQETNVETPSRTIVIEKENNSMQSAKS